MKKLLIAVCILLSAITMAQTGLNLGNYPTGGSIGSAASTFEVSVLLNIAQTTTGQTITIPDPTNTAAGKLLYFTNTGTVPFTLIPGGIIYPGTGTPGGAGIVLRWTGSAWSTVGVGTMATEHAGNLILGSPDGSTGYPIMRQLTYEDLPAKTFSFPSRGFNSSFQVSTTQDFNVKYCVQIASTLINSGTIFLELSPDNSNWTEVTRFSVPLLSLTLTQQLSAFVPEDYWVRLRTTGAATFTFLAGQESSN